MLKGEFYKFLHSRFIYYTILLIFIYFLVLNSIYFFDHLNILELYENFIDEVHLLLVILMISYSSSSITDEYEYLTINDFNSSKIIGVKIIMNLIFIIMLLSGTFLICYDLSIIFFKPFIVSLNIIKQIILQFIKILPLYVALSLLAINLGITLKKGNLCLIVSYIFCFAFTYLSNYIMAHNYKILYLFSIINFNFNKHYIIEKYISIPKSLLVCGISINTLIIIALIMFKHKKMK